MTMRRALAPVLSKTLAFGWFAAWELPRPSPVLALGCVGPSVFGAFAANTETHTNDVDGAKATIEFKNEALCTTAGSADFSSYWAAVVGLPTPTGKNIYQIGVDKCRGTACVPGVPVNQPYYFWAYGREAANGCAALSPTPHDLGDASATNTYTVIRELTPGAGFFWNTYIGSTKKSIKTDGEINGCWNGVDEVQFANEVFDKNAQSGGSTGNKQTFSSVNWNDDGTWKSVLVAPGADCEFIDLPTMRCKWQIGGAPAWDSWDTRF